MEHKIKEHHGIDKASVIFSRIFVALITMIFLFILIACESPASGDEEDTSTLPPLGQMNPADGSSVTSKSPTLSWGAMSGAKTYELQIADSSKGVLKADIIETFTNSYTPSSSLMDNKTYYWRVRGKTHTALSKWSDIYSLLINTSGSSGDTNTGGTNTGGTNTGGTNTGGTNTGGTNTGGTNTGGTNTGGTSGLGYAKENGIFSVTLDNGNTYEFKYTYGYDDESHMSLIEREVDVTSIDYTICLYDDDIIPYTEWEYGDDMDILSQFGYIVFSFNDYYSTVYDYPYCTFWMTIDFIEPNNQVSQVNYSNIFDISGIKEIMLPAKKGDTMDMTYVASDPITPAFSTGKLTDAKLVSFTISGVQF